MTVTQELIDAKAKIESLEAGALKATETIEAGNKTIAELQASVKALTDEKTALVDAHTLAIAKLNESVEASAKALEASEKQLAEANKKLASPAYKMASAKGDETPIPEGGQAQAVADLTPEQAHAEYRKLDGKPDEQKAFRAKNWRVLGCEEEK